MEVHKKVLFTELESVQTTNGYVFVPREFFKKFVNMFGAIGQYIVPSLQIFCERMYLTNNDGSFLEFGQKIRLKID